MDRQQTTQQEEKDDHELRATFHALLALRRLDAKAQRRAIYTLAAVLGVDIPGA